MTTATRQNTRPLNAADQRTYSLSLTGQVEMHDTLYIAFCNQLPLIGAGTTADDAMDSFLGCLKEYLRLSEEWGILDQVMSDYRFDSPSINITTGHFALTLPTVSAGSEQPVAA